MHSPSRRKTYETQKGDSDVLDVLMMIAAAAAALGAIKIANCGSVRLDDLAEGSPELAAALEECGERFEEAEANGWVPVVDRSEPEPNPTGIAEECSTMAADAGWKPCLGQGWTWEEAGGMVFGVNSPNQFCPKR